MEKFTLQACRLDKDDRVQEAVWQEEIWALDLNEAIAQAKMTQIQRFVDNTDYAWLTDIAGRCVWAVTVKESYSAQGS